jgi:hypothetical protein
MVNKRSSSAVHRSIIAVRYTASYVALVKRESNEMAGSTPSTEDSHQDAACKEEYELNLEMWRHYDNLRQEKSKTFLTAQTILIAVSGFVFKSQDLNSAALGIFLAISVLGLGSSALWFLLLVRNAGYIRFHRERVVELEEYLRERVVELEPFTTFSKKWSDFDRKQLWPRKKLLQKQWPRRSSEAQGSSNTTEDKNTTEHKRLLVRVFGSSNMIDRLLALLFVAFWLGLGLFVGGVFPF